MSTNRTLSCSPEEKAVFARHILQAHNPLDRQDITNRLIGGDFFTIANYLPSGFADLIIVDPPYNLSKNFNGNWFRKLDDHDYSSWFATVIDRLIPLMKPTATLYVCSDWMTSNTIFPVLKERLHVRNRITWEREKGRGSKTNWKNNTEDIWFCTLSERYYFDVDAVKLRRKVLAPYRAQGKPKDWIESDEGRYRLTHPSNIWTDLTVPFWSMPENTRHPTQKPEKLLAKLILASSKKDDFVFDPFLGSGTSVVVAAKLARNWCGVDINWEYLCWAQKRLDRIQSDPTIQGYSDNVFWERNSSPVQKKTRQESQKQVQEQCDHANEA